ncbi:S24/S26 family peptidase [Cerasicoccus frondis]|uniref:S24/S26 family peptidase n=1 Tax=Cerasicoccus frondis TaxID=490090 RepID=UPI0028529AE6|nr:S24/S26 family peptidase [Cerasicoccus frondis]
MKTPAISLLIALLTFVASAAEGRYLSANIKTDVPMVRAIDDALQAAQHNQSWMVMLGKGVSMDPYYGSSSVLLVSPTPFQKLKPGMMAVFRDADGDLVGHWLVRLEGQGWVTQGANNFSEDPEIMTASAYEGVIFGVLNSAGADAQGMAYAKQLGLPTVIGKSR